MEKKTASKVKTGIPGFDELLSGGFPPGKTILLSGAPGTGKTIFALQFIYNGAKHFGERCLYVSFEEDSQNLRNQAKMFDWDIPSLEKSGKLRIFDIAPKDITETTASDIVRLMKKEGFSRVVIDSLSALAINSPTTYVTPSDITEISIKRFMYRFIHELRSKDVIALLISQSVDNHLSRDGVSEFACDGIIHIQYESLGGQYNRHLIIRKMREVANNEDIHPLEIGEKGIVIHSLR